MGQAEWLIVQDFALDLAYLLALGMLVLMGVWAAFDLVVHRKGRK